METKGKTLYYKCRCNTLTPYADIDHEGNLYKGLTLDACVPILGFCNDTEHCDNNVNKLVFGKGTRLHVTPKIPEHTTPSVYILKSNENTGELPSSVCLVTDFPSYIGSISGYQYDEQSERELNDTLLLDSSGQEWRYGSIFWDNKPLDEPKCNVKYNDGQLQTQADNDIDKCSESSNQDYFETDERINTTSLTVLGLRLLTVKAIVFNMIITLRLWSS
ncbi:Hypothetical predicted protein [Pelobates cultripes]|uniref:Uncharacterized protein n=1 Tax=Pelobates cultripes TaxID=61616 RepID=A0AAD1W9J0_PELCU|nr:Hypothetical predicted protein [Pelobates cultripes]